MTNSEDIQLIHIDKINILNPRTRSRRHHLEIIESIKEVGLKRPITVRRREEPNEQFEYDLVCGQGRIEAFRQLGQHEIWACILNATEAECLVMSLVENIARRNRSPLEQMKEISALKERGYNHKQISQKIGTTESWVNMIGTLLDHGEGRLLSAVDNGLIPVSLAIDIARGSTSEIQDLLTQAYERGDIQGRKITTIRNILEKREKISKAHSFNNVFGRKNESRKPISQEELLEIYNKEMAEDELLTKHANYVQEQLIFLSRSFNKLRSDQDFIDILIKNQLNSLPEVFAEMMKDNNHD